MNDVYKSNSCASSHVSQQRVISIAKLYLHLNVSCKDDDYQELSIALNLPWLNVLSY